MIDYIEFDDGFAIATIHAPAATHELTLAESGVREKFGITVVGIKRVHEDFQHGTPSSAVRAGDLLIVWGPTKKSTPLPQAVGGAEGRDRRRRLRVRVRGLCSCGRSRAGLTCRPETWPWEGDGMLDWILSQFRRQASNDLERARALVRAADRGERCPDSKKACELARALGLEISTHASAGEAIDKIRRFVARRGMS